MRALLLSTCILAASCAVKPESSRFYYKGVYAPGVASVSENGSFIASASVWSEDDLNIARRAAITRLRETAENEGYRYVRLEDSSTSRLFGHRFMVKGRLYSAANRPDGAATLDELAEDGLTLVAATAEPIAPVEFVPVKLRPNPPPRKSDQPLVIKAPDFISSAPRSPLQEQVAAID